MGRRARYQERGARQGGLRHTEKLCEAPGVGTWGIMRGEAQDDTGREAGTAP